MLYACGFDVVCFMTGVCSSWFWCYVCCLFVTFCLHLVGFAAVYEFTCF